jgi:hypothetical protein
MNGKDSWPFMNNLTLDSDYMVQEKATMLASNFGFSYFGTDLII